jgi:wobble nucleotide-excising tRNase
MLKRVEWLKDCGIFENFRWNASVPDFERINVIFGTNGAGKTSLARTLDSLRGERGGYDKASVCLRNADKTNERQSNQAHDAEFDRVFVFSDGYVQRSHDFNGDTEVEAVLTLGDRTVEDEKRISELQDLIDSVERDRAGASEATRDSAKALDLEYTTVARSVVNALSRAGGEYRSNGSYSQARAKARFGDSHAAWDLLTDPERDSALATVNSDERQMVLVRSYSLSVKSTLRRESSEVLAASPVSVVLDTLEQHDEASAWVEAGRHLHGGLDTCIFCGGALTEVRRLQIEQHFSEEVERVQRTTDALIQEAKDTRATLQSLLGDDAVSGSLFDDLRDGFKESHVGAILQAEELDRWLNGLLQALEKKRRNVVASVDYEITEPPSVDGSKIEEALSVHNQRVSLHANLVQVAAKRIELHILKESESKIAELGDAAKTASESEAKIVESLNDYRQEITSLENVEGDPLPSADVMATELTRILGRSELSFDLLPDGKHYRVTRYGQPARDLSTGERTAITLIHFLQHVKLVDKSMGKPIVVIDDPISSLDSGTAFGISTYIWSEAVSKEHIEQVFLLTHNFELFRQWDIQVEGLPGGRGSNNKKGFTSSSYELVAPYQNLNGVQKRVPGFIVWPPDEATRLKVRSTYHHAFITAVRAYAALDAFPSLESRLDAQLLFPNVLRRMLETFLAFKDPTSVGNFTTAMRDIGAGLEAGGYTGDADALRLQLTRFTHANSHAESPETDVVANPDEIGATIAAVFALMNFADRKHFQGLCEVVGVEPTDLLIEAQSVTGTPSS